jgi:hypothetical protein
MTYIPRRDGRFEYLTDALAFIEERQCGDCVFQFARDGFYMCGEIEAKVFAEQPVLEINDLGDEGLFCKLYQRDPEVYRQEPVDKYTEPLL